MSNLIEKIDHYQGLNGKWKGDTWNPLNKQVIHQVLYQISKEDVDFGEVIEKIDSIN